ncbi:hypothetical protein C8R43DRAFT_909977 [Mycena crocata]|nr:hypothetical protein C8R43DRAFT_909977 [Mycena crocata]
MWGDEDFDDFALEAAVPEFEDITEGDLHIPGLIAHSPLKRERRQRKTSVKSSGRSKVKGKARKRKKTGTSTEEEAATRPQRTISNQSLDGPGDADFNDPESSSDFYDGVYDRAVGDADYDQDLNDGTVRESEYEDFAEGVSIGTIGFYQISKTVFVCEGWQGSGSDGRWYHLQTIPGVTDAFVCTCNDRGECMHTRYMAREGLAGFSKSKESFAEDSTRVILFSRDLTKQIETFSMFSVATPHSTLLKNRAIVTNIGDGSGDGQWTCSKDSQNLPCAHRNSARKYLLRLSGREDPLGEENGDMGVIEEVPGKRSPELSLQRLTYLSVVPVPTRAVSHLSIMPPVWSALETDEKLYTRVSTLMPPPLFPLGTNARCSCGAVPSQSEPVKLLECTAYTLTQAYTSVIEVRVCHECSIGRRRNAGPDCREWGFFNFNNRILFSHALLDDYTASYTAIETPFAGWVSTVAKRYETMESKTFVDRTTFSTAWFLFADLQLWGAKDRADMKCPDCGSEPKTTIWDGVTLAFGRTKLSGTLCPPTLELLQAPEHLSKSVKDQQVLIERDLRKAVRNIIRATVQKTPASTGVEGLDSDSEMEEARKLSEKASAEAMQRIASIPTVCDRLKSVHAGLGAVFEHYWGVAASLCKVAVPEEYKVLFEQIAAEESVLQMIPVTGMQALSAFLSEPTAERRAALLPIPAVYRVLIFHERTSSGPPLELQLLLGFLIMRTLAVSKALIDCNQPLERPQNIDEDPWDESGVYYSMPAIRFRPSYPHLKHDGKNEGSKRGVNCNKFYGQYGKQRLTGGIMCVWCTHSVCYGFHCIPAGEGRNDVFSAIVTRFKKAPAEVCYDFSCALAAYCMTREPKFFAQTRFVIDDFHSTGHTKCSSACFLKTYAKVDERLSKLNSSAAECGNGGLGRIRKAVSYMGQRRAIVFTRVFLSIWNRAIIRKRVAQGQK